MSLYRPIPSLNLTANVDQPLSPFNLRHYRRLWYWTFFFPQALQHHVRPKPAQTVQNSNGGLNTPSSGSGGRRWSTLTLMSLLILVVVLAICALALFYLQSAWAGLNQQAAWTGAVVGALIGLGSAILVYILQRSQGKLANAIVLGMATGVAYTIISTVYLGETLDRGMLDMLWALIYGFVAGSSIGVMMNLALVLTNEAPPPILRALAALLFSLGIFLVNSLEPQPEYWRFRFGVNEEKLWASLFGALAFYGGAELGLRRPLDWAIGKLYLNLQLFNQPSPAQYKQFTEGTSLDTHFAPPLEAVFAPTAPAPLGKQPYLPHVTLYPIQQLRFLIEAWLDHDWERGIENTKQIWRYTQQRPITALSLHQILHEGKPDDQLGQVSKFVDKLDGDDWPMLFYPKGVTSKTIDTLQAAQLAAGKHDPHTLATLEGQNARKRHQRRLLRQAMKTTQLPLELPLDTLTQRTVAGFWYLTHSFVEEGTLALQDLPDSDLAKELKAIATAFQKLLFTKDLLAGSPLELPERPKEPKRKATWDAIDKLKATVRFGRLYHQCRTPEKQTVAYETALRQLQEIEGDAAKVPGAERPTIMALVTLWRHELAAWRQASRSWQKMKADNPFIFQESLRGRKPFVGRDQQLKALKAAGADGSHQSVLLYGLAYSGKSSLVQKATLDYHETICFTLFSIVETEKAGLSVKTVLWALCQALNRRTQQALPDEKKFQIDPFAVTEEMIRTICRRFAKVTQTIVISNFDLLSAAGPGAHLQGLTITSRERIADSLLTFWWRLAGSIGNLTFVFVSQKAETAGSPFERYLKKIQVGPLEFKEIEKLLNTPTPDFVPLFSQRAAALVFHLSGGQPYLAQLLAHCVLDQFNRNLEADPKPEPVFLEDDVEAATRTPLFEQFSQPYFRTLLDQLETLMPGSNTVLRVIAPHEGGIDTPALEEGMSSRYTWGTLDPILDFLQQQGIVKAEEGWWRVVGELLRRVAAREIT